jgi:hypothetical protein
VIEETEHTKLVQKLIDEGFTTGWALNGTDLVLWEHEAEPPKPLKRPEA